MEEIIYYSATTRGFYFLEDKHLYDEHGTWPGDLQQVTREAYDALFAGQANGYEITPDAAGMPVLALPVIDHVATASLQKQRLLSQATAAINNLQDAIDLNEATREEKKSLLKWKAYRLALSKIDTSLAPGITWPSQPSQS